MADRVLAPEMLTEGGASIRVVDFCPQSQYFAYLINTAECTASTSPSVLRRTGNRGPGLRCDEAQNDPWRHVLCLIVR